jgi:hypothetical protein
MNYIFNDEYPEQVVPVRFHLSGDFYDFNPDEIWDRVLKYAGIYPWQNYVYTPSLRFDGGYYGDPSDDSLYNFQTYADWYARVRHVIDSLLVIPSPIRIDVVDNYQDIDSVYVTFDLVAKDVVPTTLRLYVAATESLHRYPFPTGRHFHAFRDFATSPFGYPLAMENGDSLRFQWSYPIDPVYRVDRLVTNIWVEDPITREVLQAKKSRVPDISGVDVADVSGLKVGRNVPNPFSTKTDISFSVRSAGKVRLGVYTPAGRLVATLVDRDVEAGSHHVMWDGKDAYGRDVASGVYYYRVDAEEDSRAGKMILLR